MSSIVYHNPDLTQTYYLIIPHPDTNQFQVLLQLQGDDWILPHFEPKEHHYAIVDHINDHIKEKWGLKTAVLRCFKMLPQADGSEHRYYALDNRLKTWQNPQETRWANEQDVKRLAFAREEQRDILLAWFDWIHSKSSMRAPWMNQGWFDRVSAWMVDLADRMAMEEIGVVHQVRAWARSATLSLSTKDEKIFFKAVSDVFNYEPVVTRVISLRYKGNAPEVKAVHVENGWMLMRDFGGKPLSDVHDLDTWKRVVRRYAEMQIDIVGSTQSFIALGVPDRNVDYLATQIERLFGNLPPEISESQATALKRLSPRLKNLCFDLVEHNVPLSLTHGDLWSGNIIIQDNGQPLFFDWSDASISHPFFDLATLLNEIEHELPDVPDAKSILRDTYLDVWTRFEPMQNLYKAYEIAEILAYVHQALFYFAHILPRLEGNTRWEMQHMIPVLLEHVLYVAQGMTQEE